MASAMQCSTGFAARVDAALLRHAATRFRKIAMVVGKAMSDLKPELDGIVDLFYAERVRRLIEHGELEVQGDPRRMRFSEVRRPG